MKILVVDDEAPVIETIGEFLEDCGYTVATAGDGLAGLEYLEGHPDTSVVVSDVRMPRMDGIEFLKNVRLRFPAIPVVLITGHGDEALAVAALQQGATDYVKKPLKLREFKACMEALEERQALEQRLNEATAAVHAAGTPSIIAGFGPENVMVSLEYLESLWRQVKVGVRVQVKQDGLFSSTDYLVDEMTSAIAHLREDLARCMASHLADSGTIGLRS